MKTSIFLLLSFLSFPLSAATQDFGGQTAKNLKENNSAESVASSKDSPTIANIRLGMSLSESRTAAPELELSSRKRKNEIGVSISLSSKQTDEIVGVVNKFLDDKLVEIDVLLNSSVKWSNVSAFVDDLSKKLDLPRSAWKFDDEKKRYIFAEKDFMIEVIEINHIILSDAAFKLNFKK